MEHIVERFRITPEKTALETLSPKEIKGLILESRESRSLFERCALAVLYSGQATDDARTMLERYKNFRIEVIMTAGGIEIELHNAPAVAFVNYDTGNGESRKMIEGVRQHIFAVLRDIVFIQSEMERTNKYDLNTPDGITDSVFLILRNARIFEKLSGHKTAVCWGGHAVAEREYDYTKHVGYELGLRSIDVVTGCGAGAMKGPMKGATIAHAKQRIKNGCYLGITEPGIIASESPNAIVDPLVIMPDIEKRLEAFVRLAHGIIIFPGGVGTVEEIIYLLGILSHPRNADTPFPLILTGPANSNEYFDKLDRFLKHTLGNKIEDKYRIVVGDPEQVALRLDKGIVEVKKFREGKKDSYYFNRSLFIPSQFQRKYDPSHEEASKLIVVREQEPYLFASTLRKVFSTVVWGNIKPEGIHAVEEKGPLSIHGEKVIMSEIDDLLASFVAQKRMLIEAEYKPCYRIVMD